MKKSNNCVYCGTKLIKSMNNSNSKSVEHMIPQIAVTINRDKSEGDFHVCRECNSDKSKLDEMFGLLSRLCNNLDKEAVKKIKSRLKNNKKFINMFACAKRVEEGYSIKIPMTGKDIYKYGVYLTKGEYYKKTGEFLSDKNNIVLIRWMGHGANNELKKWYKTNHNGGAPFVDLAQNAKVENINKECFIVSSDDALEHAFFFNETFIIRSDIAEKTEANIIKQKLNKKELIKGILQGNCNNSVV